jgi:hypothetical protein
MDKKLLYKRAYRILENCTPLKIDCGLICGRKCCSGDRNTGMHLYPGEEVLLSSPEPGFLKIRKEIFAGSEILFAVCTGRCERRRRPLACRIYPYVPYLDSKNRLSVIADPRAKYICPLLMESAEVKTDFRFLRKLRKIFRLMIDDPEIHKYIRALSEELDEYMRFVG